VTAKRGLVDGADLAQVLRGFLMGGADIIPGVSGGTVALIVGIYQRLVAAISHFDLTLLDLLRRREWSAAVRRIDLRFLIFLFAGILLGILSLASLMHHLLEHQRQPTYAVFFGLILASTWIVSRMVRRWSPGALIGLVLGAVFAYVLVGLPLLQNPPSGNLYVFFSGMVAICAMILPGISGAFILLILGKYADITGLLRSLLHGEITTDAILTIVTFAAGCGIGLLGFSKLLRWLLERHATWTVALLCGFMAGSLRKIWPFKRDLTPQVVELKLKQFENVLPGTLDGPVLLVIVLALAAGAGVLLLQRLSRRPASQSDPIATPPASW
jgi:putative membrane protein